VSDEQRDEQRTDLPHDQVAEENRHDEDPTVGALDIDERGTGMAREGEALIREQGTGLPRQPRENFTLDEGRTFGEPNVIGDEETASEISPLQPPPITADTEREIQPIQRDKEQRDHVQKVESNTDAREAVGVGLGWTALILSIASLFLLPILTATAGIVIGFFAARSGARTLGIWAIAIGALSILLSLVFAPFNL
jgi:hypothetical protein